MIPLALSLLAVAMLLINAWDAVKGAETSGKRLRAKIIAAIGLLAIAIQWWQTLDATAEPRKRMVEAIAAEQIANLDRMDAWAKPEEQEMSRIAITELQSAAVKGAIASALFAAKTDNALLESLTRMNELVDELNKRIHKTRELMWSRPAENNLDFRRKLKDGPAYQTTRQQAISLLSLLVKQYDLDPKRQYFGTQAPQMK